MSEENKPETAKPVGPPKVSAGWNDPPPNIPMVQRPSGPYKLNQRVSMPLFQPSAPIEQPGRDDVEYKEFCGLLDQVIAKIPGNADIKKRASATGTYWDSSTPTVRADLIRTVRFLNLEDGLENAKASSYALANVSGYFALLFNDIIAQLPKDK